MSPRVCLKDHSRHPHAPLCGIFGPYSVAVARYAAFIRDRSLTIFSQFIDRSQPVTILGRNRVYII